VGHDFRARALDALGKTDEIVSNVPGGQLNAEAHPSLAL
jgi:hypothetical protein